MKRVVMIDLDGVVLDKKYQTTKDISKSVKRASKKLLLVPNSDTPIYRLENFFFEAMGLRCMTIIGELGATLKHRGSMIQVCSNPDLGSFVSLLSNKFISIGSEVHLCDSTTWVRECRFFQPNHKLVLIDAFRLQTVGMFFLKTTAEGKMSIDADWSNLCMDVIKKTDRPNGLSEFCYNRKYGFAGCNAKGITKTEGYLALKKTMPGAQFYMVGDSDIDIINSQDVVHLSVANASEKLKSISMFVSTFSYTHGLEDCLNWVLEKV